MNALKNFMLVLAAVVIAVFLLEGVGFIINQTNNPGKTKHSGDTDFIVPDRVLGYKPAPNRKIHDALSYNGQSVYDVHYTTDRFSRRVTPLDGTTGRSRFALFFGCSHLFGEGVEDDQTLPYFFGRECRTFVPYNYGFMGYGPQQTLMKLYLTPIREEIPEQEGYGFYLYIGHWHVYRAIGEMVVMNGWGDSLPFFTINDREELVCHGPFKSARPLLSRIYRILGESQCVKAFGITFPPFLTARHYRLTARILKAAQDKYKGIFHNENFYVIIAPATHPSVLAASVAIIPFLEKEGVKYLDYSTLIDFSEENYNLKGDGHPTPLANEVIAEKLAADIERMEKN